MPTRWTLIRSLSHKFASPGIHALVVHKLKAPCFGLHEADDFRIVKIRPILGVLFFRKGSEIGLASQCFDTLAKFIADFPINEFLRRLRREPSGSRIQELV